MISISSKVSTRPEGVLGSGSARMSSRFGMQAEPTRHSKTGMIVPNPWMAVAGLGGLALVGSVLDQWFAHLPIKPYAQWWTETTKMLVTPNLDAGRKSQWTSYALHVEMKLASEIIAKAPLPLEIRQLTPDEENFVMDAFKEIAPNASPQKIKVMFNTLADTIMAKHLSPQDLSERKGAFSEYIDALENRIHADNYVGLVGVMLMALGFGMSIPMPKPTE